MKKVFFRFFALGLIAAGVIFILNAGLPILRYELFQAPRFKKAELLSPVSQRGIVMSATQGSPDLTKASNWFEDTRNVEVELPRVRFYTLSIPKLGIRDAVAEIGGEDLSKGLVHYKGTALPGKIGNSVIFGHSILPQFFDPKNYLSIFSTLPRLEKGDKIIIDYDGITYTYEVQSMFETQPDDLAVLGQDTDGVYISLITCVPPGTYLRRLVVKAKLLPQAKLVPT
ncbi:MAG: sortase [Candidatus Blackburnbacteria bacterium]|nr:sortase [Candidatus Blackburnbacteria bacterium]